MRLSDIYQKYHNSVEFLVIYIREAHPVNGWWFGGGISGLAMKFLGFKAARDVHDPETNEARRQVALRCAATLDYGIPTLVDTIDDQVNKAYAAWPTWLYLIGKDGRVVYAGGLGPFGFKPAELGEAIAAQLSVVE